MDTALISGQPGNTYSLVLVTGDRNYDNPWVIQNALIDTMQELGQIIVIHGDQQRRGKGADHLCQKICEEMGIHTYRHPAQWVVDGKYHPEAGLKRNSEMLEYPNIAIVLAFHDYLKNSRGTLDTVNKALEKGLRVKIFEKGKVREMHQEALPLFADDPYMSDIWP